MKNHLLFFIFYLSYSVNAQSLLVGKLIGMDTTEVTAVSFGIVSMVSLQSGKQVSNAIANEDGGFTLRYKETGFYELKVYALGYHDFSQNVFIEELATTKDTLILRLRSNVFKLDEVTVTAERTPIIFKKDTIIYNLEYFKTDADQTLEDALRKIPGISIDKNGEITHKGRKIERLLIDGEQFLDLGHALTTKSITPEMVDNIEVRLNDTTSHLKNSLLEETGLLVLDIKLSDELNKTFFGRAKVFGGSQESNWRANYYTNMFSLREKQKYHFLSEWNHYGMQNIFLSDLQNIDPDAYNSIFSLPANFSDFQSREGFQEGIFGFTSAQASRPSMLGFSSYFTPNNNLIIKFGVYANRADYEKQEFVNRTFNLLEQDNIDFYEHTKDNQLRTRISITYKNNEKWLLQSDIIYMLRDATNRSVNQVSTTYSRNYLWNQRNQEHKLSAKFQAEHKLNDKLAIDLNALVTKSSSDDIVNLTYQDTLYGIYFGAQEHLYNDNFHQTRNVNNFLLSQKIGLRYNLGIHYFTLGGINNLNILNTKANSQLFSGNSLLEIELQPYNFEQNPILFNLIKPYIAYTFISNVQLDAQLGYPIQQLEQKNTTENLSFKNFDYSLKARTTIGMNGDFSVLYRKEWGVFHGRQLQDYLYLVDFQIIDLNYNTIPPQPEELIQASFNPGFLKQKQFDVQFASLMGRTQLNDTYLFNDYGLVESSREVINQQYALFYTKISKLFVNQRLKLSAEYSFLHLQRENTLYINAKEKLQSKIYIYTLSIQSMFKQNINFTWQSGLNNYLNFTNKESTNQLSYWSNKIELSSSFFKKQLQNRISFLDIYYVTGSKLHYVRFDIEFYYKYKSWQPFVSINNLFNNKELIKQELSTFYHAQTATQLIPRYLNMGIQYTFL